MDISADKNDIAGRLGLSDAAEQDARAGIPATSAEAPTGNEAEAVEAALSFGAAHIKRAREHCGQIAETHARCSDALRDSRGRREQAVGGAPPESDLDIVRAARDNAIAAYKQFKNDNELKRDASNDDRLAQFVWVLAVVLVEGVFNSYFFAPASGSGLFGGFVTAFFISAVNVGFAFLGGVLGLRYAKNHCNPAANLGGLVWFLLCVLVCLAMISLATFYRGHIESFRDGDLEAARIAAQASDLAVASLLSADGAGLFGSVDSVILFFAGILCAITGVWKGYEYDDPYPGFGAMWRQKEEFEERQRESLREHAARMDGWRKTAGADIRKTETSLRDAAKTLSARRDGMDEKCGEIAELPSAVAALAGGLLNIYRARNGGIRATEPPRYFSEYPKSGDDEFNPLRAQCEEVLRRAGKLQEQADSLLAECEEEFREVEKALR